LSGKGGKAAMIKILLFIKKKDGLSRSQFVDYYENRHVPLIRSHVGRFLTGYTRNYIDPGAPLSASTASGPSQLDVDVVTELIVKDEATMQEMFSVAGEPDVAAEIAADEEKFVDRSASRMFIAEVYPR
jgi:uncharacterized protein (TIGR02118 family)